MGSSFFDRLPGFGGSGVGARGNEPRSGHAEGSERGHLMFAPTASERKGVRTRSATESDAKPEQRAGARRFVMQESQSRDEDVFGMKTQISHRHGATC
jgi:hypothetical protein